MKNIRYIISLLFLSATLYAQKDSLTMQFGNNITVYKNIFNGRYAIKKGSTTIGDNLKFVNPIWGSYLQVLDKRNSLFYIDNSGEKTNTIQLHLGLCLE